MKLSLFDSAVPDVFGDLSNPDAFDPTAILNGGVINLLIDEFTSSGDVKELFNLAPPPSFSGPFNVWARLEEDKLKLFLAADALDPSFPLASLDGFAEALRGGTSGGTGELFRPNRLPGQISWSVIP